MSAALPPVNFTWRVTEDAERVHAIHQVVIAKMHAGMVRPDQLSHFASHMGEHGHTLGCFLDDGTMVAYGVVGLQSHTVDHLAGLLDADPHQLCVLDGASSLPEWRGYSLHCTVIDERVKYGASIGRSVVGATVSPDNIRSLRGLFRAKMEVHCFALLYGGLARLVLKRELLAGERNWKRELRVATTDHQGHRDALAAGLVGYACRQAEAGGWVIDYGRADRAS